MRSLAAFPPEALFRPVQVAQSVRVAPRGQAGRQVQALWELEAQQAWAVPFLSEARSALPVRAVFSQAFPIPLAGSDRLTSEFLRTRPAWTVLSASAVPILLGHRFPVPRLSAVLPLKLAGQVFLFLPFPQSESQSAYLQKALLRFPC